MKAGNAICRNSAMLMAMALLLSAPVAWTQEDDVVEATIRLMKAGEAELPDAVTREIRLPESLAENSAAVENAARGLATANENRSRGEDGLAIAEEARQRGAEMAEKAMENREDRGRSEDPPGPPDLPDNPGPPDTPGPPESG